MSTDDELARHISRWRAAEQSERDDEADAAFGVAFRAAVASEPVSPLFAGNAMRAVAAAAARDARTARWMRRGMVAGSSVAAVLAVYFGGTTAIAGASIAFTRALSLLVGVVVQLVITAHAGAAVWGIVTSLGRAAAAFVGDPEVTVMLFVIQGIAIGALVALQRLLGSDRESFK